VSPFLFDLRDALRGLGRDRFYSATVVATLALTIGAAAAVFSIVDGVLLKPLQYPDAARLVTLQEIWREASPRGTAYAVNERHFEYWREHARSFESMAQYVVRPANLMGTTGDAVQIALARTSGSLFDVLQVRAAAGRTLTTADEGRDRPDVIVLSDSTFRERFNSDTSIVGRTVALDGRPHTVVGVLPPDFRLPQRGQLTARVDAFVPLRIDVGWVGDHNDDAIGRLRAGVSPEKAQAELDVLQRAVSEVATKEAHEPVTLSSVVTLLMEAIVGRTRRGLALLFGAIVAVLLIACSNLANLTLTRASGRARDAAIRTALGANRARLVVRALLEQGVLAAVGGGLGLWIAWAALAVFVRTAPVDLPRVNEVTIDVRVVTFAAIVSMLSAVFVAAVPAWRTAARDVQAALRLGGAASTADRGGLRTRAALLAVQVALSVVLLAVTGLLTASFLHVVNMDRGFRSEHLLAIDLALPASRYSEEAARQAAYDRLIDAVRALPSVERVTTTSMLPLGGNGQVNAVVPEGSTAVPSERASANFRMVAPEYFQTMGIQILRGRAFSGSERDSRRPLPALVSEPTAARLWPGLDPIGRRFSRGLPGERGFEIVGVVADARMTSIEQQPPLMVYVPYWWRSRTATSIVVRTSADPAALLGSLRRAIRSVDPEIGIGQVQTVEQLVDRAMAARRYQAQLFVAFGVIALVIATLGAYAVTSQGVARRRREMNIRVALGAPVSAVRAMILRESVRPLLLGASAGIVGALALGDVVASLLFEVRPRDPLIIATVTTAVGAAGLLAALTAVRRGLSIDPATALRED
jgi:predicted permease